MRQRTASVFLHLRHPNVPSPSVFINSVGIEATGSLKLQVENRFPSIWMPSTELRDLRTLLKHRHQWARMRTRVQNTLQAIALIRGLRRGTALWSQAGQHAIESLPLPPHSA